MITLGNVLFCVIGVVVGASIMYGFEVFMDWKEDCDDAQREAVIREAFDRLKEKEMPPFEKEDRGHENGNC